MDMESTHLRETDRENEKSGLKNAAGSDVLLFIYVEFLHSYFSIWNPL